MAAEPTLLHRAALDDLLREATTPQRWLSRTELAGECGFHPTTLSLAVSGRRGLSDAAMDSLLGVTGWDREALLLPVQARRGDLETVRLTAELRRLREQVSEVLLRGTDNVADAIRDRNGG